MELRDLDHDERLALVALITRVVEANARATDEESATVRRIAKALGRAEYRRLAEEADGCYPDGESLRALLRRSSVRRRAS